MELTNEFRVPVPVDQAWEILTDVERIAPCMPGAQLTEIEGEEYRGRVKVKVGPITAQYKGSAVFLEKDDVNHRAVLDGKGRDTRGQGNANAVVTAQLTPDGDDATLVSVVTDLKVTGKVAQFGRGVMADVSSKLLEQFVECLESKILASDDEPAVEDEPAVDVTGTAVSGEATPAASSDAPSSDAPSSAASPAAASSAPRKIDMPEPEAVDLLDTAGAPVAKRLAPLALVLIIVLLLLRRRRS